MKRFTILFLGIALAELFAIYYAWRFPWLEFLVKPLILLSLIGFIIFSTKGIKCRFKSIFIVALIFSGLGDVFLMFDEAYPILFTVGLGAFLISHLLYIIAFHQTVHPPLEVPLIKKHPWLIFILILYGVYVFQLLKPQLNEMVVPVLLYLITILSMFMFALNRYGKVPLNSFLWIVFGAFWFIFSDTLIAIDRFYTPVSQAHFWVMLTYMLAQYSIVHGGLLQIKQMGSNKSMR